MPPLFEDEERPDDEDEWDNEDYDYSNDDGEDDEVDEPMTEEEFDNFIDRQMKKRQKFKMP